MADLNQQFHAQQTSAALEELRHPSQRAHEMEDAEKIYHLQREIDNLRSQLRGSSTGNRVNAASSSSSSAAAASVSSSGIPLLTVFLVLAVVVVAIWRRTQQQQQRAGAGARRFYYAGSNPSPSVNEMTMTFELQDAHDYEGERSINASSSYAAPSAHVQFV